MASYGFLFSRLALIAIVFRKAALGAQDRREIRLLRQGR
jgi:hypothetical protein